MEILPLVHPETGELTGAHLPRAHALATRAWCRSTNVFVFNARGEILCHRRSAAKDRLPGVWSTHLGGHVGAGETYESNAAKELEEEAGLRVPPGGLLPWRTTRLDRARLWVREFVTITERAVAELTPQPGEVDEFAWLALGEVLRRSNREPAKWIAGTHDFTVEYQCMRAALAVGDAVGALRLPRGLGAWGGRLSLA
jgi:isopentenyldiphosphate isomerase